MARQLSFLIVDPDVSFYKKLKEEDPDWNQVNIKFIDKGGDAQAWIKDNRNKHNAVLISPDVHRPSGLAVIRFSLMFQPGVPIYMISSLNNGLDEEVKLEEIGVAGQIAKPFKVKDIVKLLGEGARIFNDEEAVKLSEKFGDKVDQEVGDDDKGFRPIKSDLFISGSKTMFDVYVKLRADKYIKILQAGDNFDYDRLLEYLNRGVQYFYIRSEAQENYISYCDRLTKAITESNKIPLDKKFSFLFNQCELTINTLAEMGVDNETVAYTQQYTNQVMNMVDKLGRRNSFLGNLLKELKNFEHSASVVVVASMLSKAMKIETEKSLEALGMACMLHDIGLYHEQESDMYTSEADSKFFFDEETIEEKLASGKVYADEKKMLEKVYAEHATKGAEMASNLEGINPMIPQIIRQHHAYDEKEKGSFKGGAIQPMAEILNLADRFVKLLKKVSNREKVDKEYIQNAVTRMLAAFPMRTRDIFKDLFKLK